MAAADPIAPGDIIEFKVIGFVAADPYMNVFHYVVDAVPSDTNSPLQALEKIASDFWEDMKGPYMVMLPGAAKVTGVKTRRVNPSLSPTFLKATNDSGTGTGDYLPVEDAIVFSKNTDWAGRGQRGRIFMPAVLEAIGNGDYVNATNGSVSAFTTALHAQVTGAFGSALSPVVWSGGTADVGNMKNVVSVSVNPKISHQRRRKPRF